jgi:hypothetical protein
LCPEGIQPYWPALQSVRGCIGMTQSWPASSVGTIQCTELRMRQERLLAGRLNSRSTREAAAGSIPRVSVSVGAYVSSMRTPRKSVETRIQFGALPYRTNHTARTEVMLVTSRESMAIVVGVLPSPNRTWSSVSGIAASLRER